MTEPVSQLSVEFETYLGELLANCVDDDGGWQYNRETRLAQAVQDMRGSITNMNVRLYLLEHGQSGQKAAYISSMHHSIENLTRVMEDLLNLSRQEAGIPDDVPAVPMN